MGNDPIVVPTDNRANRSESIAKLAEALSKAQGSIEGAAKDSKNPFYNSKYADLASVWGVCRKPLSDNGLAVIQLPSFDGAFVHVETVLSHASGEWISSNISMAPVKESKIDGVVPWLTPQGIGSAISYARRYGLAAMVGIYQEDDDANSASGKSHEEWRKPAAETKPREASDKPNASGLKTDAAGYAVGRVEKLEPHTAAAKPPAKTGKPYFTFQFQDKKIYCWDPSMFDWLQKEENSTIKGQIEVRNGYPTLISGRLVAHAGDTAKEERLPF